MKSMVVATGVTTQPASITIAWSDGTAGEFASVWLRDNLPEDRDRHSGQRLIDVMDIPPAPRIRSASLARGAVDVDWVDEPRRSSFDLRWLYEYASGGSKRPELQAHVSQAAKVLNAGLFDHAVTVTDSSPTAKSSKEDFFQSPVEPPTPRLS